MKKVTFYILATALLFLFSSCEYEPSGSNFIHLNPPSDTKYIKINLNDTNPGDTIYLWEYNSVWERPQSFLIELDLDAGDVVSSTTTIGEREISRGGSSSIYFSIRPSELGVGIHRLTVSVVFTSGSGSLADIFRLENYVGEASWYVRVLPNPRDNFTIGHRLNDEGFLEVYWNHKIPYHLIEKYTIRVGFETITINDPRQKSFVDYGYVSRDGFYEIMVYWKLGKPLWRTHSFSYPVPQIRVEDLGLDQLRLYWDRPFANARFNILIDSDTQIAIADITDTTVIIPQLFGASRRFRLETRPLNPAFDFRNQHNNSFVSFFQGTLRLGLDNWQLFAYNRNDNIIYTRTNRGLTAFDANSFDVINSIPILFRWGATFAGAPHNSMVAAITSEETFIFQDSRLVNPVIIPGVGNISSVVHLFAFTNDDRFFAVTGGRRCRVFDVKTGEKIFEFPFEHMAQALGSFVHSYISVSEDGRFFVTTAQSGMELFEINNTTVNLLHTDTRHYRGAMFVPGQPDKLLLLTDLHIELRQMPGFNIIQKLNVASNTRLCNIDPATGNLLYWENDYLIVTRADNIAEPIFRLRSRDNTTKLYNSRLLTWGRGGIVFDISPYLN